MLTPHFCADGRYGPDRFIQIELAPFGQTQLAGTGEHEGEQLQSRNGFWLTIEGFDRAQESPERLGVCDGGAVLDLGCGSGAATASLTRAGFAVTALDASEGLLALARQAAPGARFVAADFAQLDQVIAPESLDGVWANFALLHLPRAAMPGQLAAIARSLKPGGAFHLSLLLGNGEGRDALGRFYSYVSAEDLNSLVRAAGFVPLSDSRAEGRSATGEPVQQIILLCRRA